eukprot:SAG31_NODE_28640_length_407_cov_0.782468_1_plen_80_part_01
MVNSSPHHFWCAGASGRIGTPPTAPKPSRARAPANAEQKVRGTKAIRELAAHAPFATGAKDVAPSPKAIRRVLPNARAEL